MPQGTYQTVPNNAFSWTLVSESSTDASGYVQAQLVGTGDIKSFGGQFTSFETNFAVITYGAGSITPATGAMAIVLPYDVSKARGYYIDIVAPSFWTPDDNTSTGYQYGYPMYMTSYASDLKQCPMQQIDGAYRYYVANDAKYLVWVIPQNPNREHDAYVPWVSLSAPDVDYADALTAIQGTLQNLSGLASNIDANTTDIATIVDELNTMDTRLYVIDSTTQQILTYEQYIESDLRSIDGRIASLDQHLIQGQTQVVNAQNGTTTQVKQSADETNATITSSTETVTTTISDSTAQLMDTSASSDIADQSSLVETITGGSGSFADMMATIVSGLDSIGNSVASSPGVSFPGIEFDGQWLIPPQQIDFEQMFSQDGRLYDIWQTVRTVISVILVVLMIFGATNMVCVQFFGRPIFNFDIDDDIESIADVSMDEDD